MAPPSLQPERPMPADDLSRLDHSVTGLRWLGLAALLAGFGAGALVSHAVASAEPGVYDEAQRARIVAIAWAVSLALSGAIAACAWTTAKAVGIDEENGLVWSHWRMLWFERRHAVPVDGRGVVVQAEREVQGYRGSWTVHVVEYVGPGGEIELHRLSERGEARSWAKRFARALDVPLAEVSDGVGTVEGPGDFDRSTAERGLADGLAWPDGRVSGRVAWTPTQSGGVRLEIAPPGFGTPVVVAVAFALVAVAVLVRTIGEIESHGQFHGGLDLAGWVWSAAMVAIAAGLVSLCVVVLRTRYVTTEVVSIEREGLRREGGSTLPADRVRAVASSSDGSRVIARSDACSFSVGIDLTEEESAAIRDLVLLGLGGPPTRD